MIETIFFVVMILGVLWLFMFNEADKTRIAKLKRDAYNSPFSAMRYWRDHGRGRTHPFANDINPSERRCFDEGWLEWERAPAVTPTQYRHGNGGAAVLTSAGLAALAAWEASRQ